MEEASDQAGPNQAHSFCYGPLVNLGLDLIRSNAGRPPEPNPYVSANNGKGLNVSRTVPHQAFEGDRGEAEEMEIEEPNHRATVVERVRDRNQTGMTGQSSSRQASRRKCCMLEFPWGVECEVLEGDERNFEETQTDLGCSLGAENQWQHGRRCLQDFGEESLGMVRGKRV